MAGISGRINFEQRHNGCEFAQTGQKVLANENNKVRMVCEGEIYNFLELRESLERKGHLFRTREGAETIIHLYEDTDIVSCVEQLRGAFAFALWDEDKQQLFLVRDRIGQRPLHYTLQNGSLIFGSEINSILESCRPLRRIDISVLDNYLTYQYISGPQTIFEGIKKLLPGHILIWKNGKVEIKSYWRLEFNYSVKMKEGQICENILWLLAESIKIRTAGNENIGIFLSGGIDSSAIAAICTRLCQKRLKAFSVGFQERSFSELQSARLIAKEFNLDYQEFIFTAKEAYQLIPKLIQCYNEPLADSSALATFFLAKAAKPYIDVVLTGDGGDEFFGGYDRYLAARLFKYYELIPRFAREKIIQRLVDIVPDSTEKRDWGQRIKRFINATGVSAQKRYLEWMSVFSERQKENLYTPRMRHAVRETDPYRYMAEAYERVNAQDIIDKIMGVDILTYLPDDGIVKVYGAMAGNRLTSRSPFLDDKVVEFAVGIAGKLKLKGMKTKYLLRKALANLLPRRILQTRKLGWGVPISKWLRKEMKEYAYAALLDERAITRGYFRPESIKQLLDEHSLGRANHSSRIWSLIMLELWHQGFIDN